MDRFPRDGRHSYMEYPDPFNTTSRGVHDQGLLSEDDYPAFQDHRMDADIDDGDPANMLTSQTLNADGTPKRPMNAFMIFARRRRPQVSAENQSMRTGDVSKILSREWNAMDSSEKQFYLDQAKQLKDSFNLKYPDYVYRRRPNNSRKKRRPDSSTATDSASGDMVDGESPIREYDETSPVEYSDSQERYGSSGPELQYPSTTPEATYEPSYLPPARASSYQQSESLYHPYAASDRRAAYLSSQEQPSSDPMGPSTPSSSGGSTSAPYYSSFPNNASNPQTASYFPNQSGNEGQWHTTTRPSREDLGRLPIQPWSQGGQESSLHPVDNRHRQYQVPQASPMSWGGTNPSEPLVSNSSTAHASSHNPNHGFPTLNSPFYPSQNSPHNPYATKRPSSQMSDTSHQYGAASHAQGSSAASRQEAAYHSLHYPPVSTMQAGYAQNSGSAMHQYHTHSRNTITPLPSTAQSMPAYPHQPSMNATPPSGSATDHSSQLP